MTAHQMTRDEILAAKDLKVVEVPIPEWGDGTGSVFVRELTALEREELEASNIVDGKDAPNPMGRVVAMSLCDKDGNRLFTLDDAPAFGAKGLGALKRIFEAAITVSKLSSDEAKKIEGNSSEGQGDGSTSV